MNKSVRSIVLTGYGTNCEAEMAYACRLAGSDVVDIVHLGDLLSGSKNINDYHFLNLPGGFLDGDHLGSAQAGANRLKFAKIAGKDETLLDQIVAFIRKGGIILGVCNGFQLMVKTGLLPGFNENYSDRLVSLTHNDSGKFEDRWVNVVCNSLSPCVFTKGLDKLELPVRHGEGKFLTLNQDVLDRTVAENLIAMQYADSEFRPTDDYPANPNGSTMAIAGICDPTGRLFGLMPHPEAFLHYTHHPRWTREPNLSEQGQGMYLFQNAIEYIKKNI